MKYRVYAKINGNVLNNKKEFKSESLANKYVDNLIETYNLEVVEDFDTKNGHEVYCNTYTRFIVTPAC